MDMCNLGGHLFGPFEWTKGGPHKHELTKFYPKLKLKIRQAQVCAGAHLGTYMGMAMASISRVP